MLGRRSYRSPPYAPRADNSTMADIIAVLKTLNDQPKADEIMPK
jgi:hypothetical protein